MWLYNFVLLIYLGFNYIVNQRQDEHWKYHLMYKMFGMTLISMTLTISIITYKSKIERDIHKVGLFLNEDSMLFYLYILSIQLGFLFLAYYCQGPCLECFIFILGSGIMDKMLLFGFIYIQLHLSAPMGSENCLLVFKTMAIRQLTDKRYQEKEAIDALKGQRDFLRSKLNKLK